MIRAIAITGSILIISLTGCAERTKTPAEQDSNITLRFGHDMPIDSAQHAGAIRFAERVAEESNGRLQIKVYPAQTLGNDHAMIDMARTGELDFTMPPTAKLSLLAPSMQLLDLPFFLSDRDVRTKVLGGRVGQTLLGDLEEHGLVGLSFWEAGVKQFTANREIRSPEDFAGLTFRVMKSEMLQDQFAALNAKSVVIDFAQTRNALRNRAVDGQENPLTSIAAMQFHKEQSHLILSNHGFLGQVVVMSKVAHDALPQELQEIIQQVANEVTPFQRAEAQRMATVALEEIRSHGTTIIELSAQEMGALRAATRKVLEKYRFRIGTGLIEQCFQIGQEHASFDPDDLVVGLDADLAGNSSLSGVAIRRGMELAIEEVNNSGGVLGRKLRIHALDNSMVSARGIDNLIELAEIPNLVAVVGGISSPVALAELEAIHEHELVFLEPWAAATKIVDNGYEPNYVFRVSVRDEFAGEFLVGESQKISDNVALLLVNNGWGRSNHQAMIKALGTHGLTPSAVEWFDWGETAFGAKIDRIYASGAETILYVGNGLEASKLVHDLAARDKPLPVVSHWGITGSDFPKIAGDSLKRVDLRVLQTFSFLNASNSEQLAERYANRYATDSVRDIVAPVGTAHTYDLVHLLAKAIAQANSMERDKIRQALERLESHVGLVKTYAPPFTADRHDALGSDSFFLTQYEGSTLVPVQP